MKFDGLKDFLLNQMRMSHIYQPVMIRRLLLTGGSSSIGDIAVDILNLDQSQVEYYEAIVKNMVGRVLVSRDVAVRVGKTFTLEDADSLSQEEVAELIQICELKIAEYQELRGASLWAHRSKSAGYISGTIRYEVLKAAGFHCELCGISADKKALEVDHIVPRNKGGSDALHNLQALCFSCNAMKRDRDSTDFRAVNATYKHREEGCIFCHLPSERIIAENELAVAIRDGFPVTPLHTLVIPKRHLKTYFDMSHSEHKACNSLLMELRTEIESQDSEVSGFNIGMNAGEAAGQTVFHCHIHLIPRRSGDVESPRGGVRHVIPGKGHY